MHRHLNSLSFLGFSLYIQFR